MPSNTASEPLGRRILKRLVDANFPPGWNQKYMPEGSLSDLFTKSDIFRVLTGDEALTSNQQHRTGTEVDAKLIDIISRSAKKVLAICILSGVESGRLHQLMKAFMYYGITDDKLPVSFKDINNLPWSGLPWSYVQSTTFQEKQWLFLVPTFRQGQVQMDICNRIILPFKLANEKTFSGTFSDVWEVEVNAAHLEKPMRKVRCSFLQTLTYIDAVEG